MNDSRWECPKCGSTNVQISLPAWHTETKEGGLTYLETDYEADVMWWYCPDCDESGSGYPSEVHPPECPAADGFGCHCDELGKA